MTIIGPCSHTHPAWEVVSHDGQMLDPVDLVKSYLRTGLWQLMLLLKLRLLKKLELLAGRDCTICVLYIILYFVNKVIFTLECN